MTVKKKILEKDGEKKIYDIDILLFGPWRNKNLCVAMVIIILSRKR